MSKITKKLATTAYHEAAHAVACVFAEGQRIGFREVSIVPNDAEGSLGHVLRKQHPAWLRREWESGFLSARADRAAMNQAVALLAGRAGASKYRGTGGSSWGSAVYYHHPEYGKVIVDGDVKRAVEYLDLISNGDPDETSILWRLAEYRARRLVSVHWELVTKLAEALLERHTLTEAEVTEVLFQPTRARARS